MKPLFVFSPDENAKNPHDTSFPLRTAWDYILEELKKTTSEKDYIKWLHPLQVHYDAEGHLHLHPQSLLHFETIKKVYLEKINYCKKRLALGNMKIFLNYKGQNIYPSDYFEYKRQDLSHNEPGEEKKILPTEGFFDPFAHEDFQSSALAAPVPKSAHFPFGGPSLMGPPQIPEKKPDVFDKTNADNSPSPGLITEISNKINSSYTFETFVRGPSNQFALASCLSIAEKPGLNYNPLFLYGSTGLGKTHLLHSVGNRFLQINPQSLIVYTSSERFMNEMIFCIRHNKMWEFRQKYRQCDILMMDDIQFISGNKAATQEEFFHTFNTLYEAKKQIVITSDLFPQDIPDIEERLRNRFQWGLIADIQPPDTEHRIAILMNKADKIGVQLNSDVAEFIANHVKKNVRELEGALHRIAAFSTLHGRPIDKALAKEIFYSFAQFTKEKKKENEIDIDLVQESVAEIFGVKLSDLKSSKRHRALSIPRQMAMYLCRELTKFSLPEIGEKFGGKDHTTVMHGVKKISELVKHNPELKQLLESSKRLIQTKTYNF